jgi:hypothetical protein
MSIYLPGRACPAGVAPPPPGSAAGPLPPGSGGYAQGSRHSPVKGQFQRFFEEK